MNKITGIILLWLFAAPVYLPWLLARFGHYKKWYLAPFIPPFSWRRMIQLWPLSAIFVCYPFVAISPMSDEDVMKVWALVALLGVILSVFMVLKNPRWAKPLWQRRLEDLFSYEQISAFIKIWRNLPFSQWCNMIDTEEGMLELADYAIENRTEFIDDNVRIRAQQLTNTKKRNLKQKPKWLFQDTENQD